MTKHVEVPKSVGNVDFARSLRGHPWSELADQDLHHMFESDSDISIMAEEMDRTERAVLKRIIFLGILKETALQSVRRQSVAKV